MDPVFFAAMDEFSSIIGALCIDEPQAGSSVIARVSSDNEAAVDALLREIEPRPSGVEMLQAIGS